IPPVFMAAESGKNIEELRDTALGAVTERHLQVYQHYLEDDTYDGCQFEHFEEYASALNVSEGIRRNRRLAGKDPVGVFNLFCWSYPYLSCDAGSLYAANGHSSRGAGLG